jgi:hypothetical protein
MYYVSNPPEHYRQGTTARIWIALTIQGQFFTPPTPPTVTIFLPDVVGGTLLIDRQLASPYTPPVGVVDQSNNFYFDFQIPSDAPYGDYPGHVDCFDNAGNSVGTPRVPFITVDPQP